jgi:lipocalin
MFTRLISTILLAILFAGCANGQKNTQMETVKNIDLNRYMGTWYEIARFPHSFEKNLVGVTATYTLKANGKVDVLNQGYKGSLNGKPSSAKAFAKIPDPSEPGRLKVYFFWPFGGSYNILDLDTNYQWALVGSDSPNFLWILSRTPQMDPSLYKSIVEKARSLGYDINRIELVEQRKAEQ